MSDYLPVRWYNIHEKERVPGREVLNHYRGLDSDGFLLFYFPRYQNCLISLIQEPLMPTVDVKMWKGVSEDAAKHIISGITKVFVELGIPERAVEVLILEIPKTHWGIGGKSASEVMPDEKPP